jgi:hypothetical protein
VSLICCFVLIVCLLYRTLVPVVIFSQIWMKLNYRKYCVSSMSFVVAVPHNIINFSLCRAKMPADWRHTLISLLGWSFDFFTVAISITDVISDVLVAVQFLQDGHSLWAWLVFGAFINSSIVYSMVLSIVMFDEYNGEFRVAGEHVIKEIYRRTPGLIRFLILLPVSQLAPTGMYVFQMFIMPYWRRKAGEVEDTAHHTNLDVTSGTGPALAAVHREEAEAVQGTFTVVGRLQQAVQRQVVTHGMLFAETIVESIPQSIIQLLAITFLGAPTTLQVVSMALSILSVVSKAYFLSLSACLRVFVFKFCVLSFDVLSMFYIFSTILSEDRSQDVALFGSDSLRVSYLAYVWFVKLVAMAGLTTFLVAVVVVSLIVAEKIRAGGPICDCDIRLKDVKHFIVAVLGVCLAVIPVVLVQESVKLSWSLVFLLRWEPKLSDVPVASMVYAFLERAAHDAAELRERQVHFMNFLEKHFPDVRTSYNHLADRVRMVGPFLYRHIDFLCDVEDDFVALHGNAYQASRRVCGPARGAMIYDHFRRAYSPLQNVFDAHHHPLGYLHHSYQLWSLSSSDRQVSQELQSIIIDRWPLYEASMTSSSSSSTLTHRDLTVATMSEALRDREVHQILAAYRAAKTIFMNTNIAQYEDCDEASVPPLGSHSPFCLTQSPSLLHRSYSKDANEQQYLLVRNDVSSSSMEPSAERGVMHRQQHEQPRDPWTKVLLREAQLTGEQMARIMRCDGFREKMQQWKFERIFHPKRLAYFFQSAPDREPPIEFVSVSHTSPLRSHNPFGYLFWCWFVINAVANCGFSIVFMFVSFATTPQNLLQKFCFWFSAGFLTVALLTLPGVSRYVRLLPSLTTLCHMLCRTPTPVAAAQDAVVSFYDVSIEAVLASTAPRDLLPTDLRGMVAALLGPQGVDKSELRRDECAAMKQSYRGV